MPGSCSWECQEPGCAVGYLAVVGCGCSPGLHSHVAMVGSLWAGAGACQVFIPSLKSAAGEGHFHRVQSGLCFLGKSPFSSCNKRGPEDNWKFNIHCQCAERD